MHHETTAYSRWVAVLVRHGCGVGDASTYSCKEHEYVLQAARTACRSNAKKATLRMPDSMATSSSPIPHHTPATGTRHLPTTHMRRLTQGPGTWNNEADCPANHYFLELESPLYSGYCLSQFDNNGLDIRIMPCQKTVGQLWLLNYENLQLGGATTIRNVASQLQIARCLQVWLRGFCWWWCCWCFVVVGGVMFCIKPACTCLHMLSLLFSLYIIISTCSTCFVYIITTTRTHHHSNTHTSLPHHSSTNRPPQNPCVSNPTGCLLTTNTSCSTLPGNRWKVEGNVANFSSLLVKSVTNTNACLTLNPTTLNATGAACINNTAPLAATQVWWW